uniref:Uncharacterized protein n=1 Tax=Panagrolaimus sp. ES5 TaxID=591445 RepID=A0AC34F001_9BILA
MSERYMPSIFPECDELKQFISPDYRHKHASNPCERLHEVYRDCVERKLEKNRPFEIDLEELRKEYLNTENDRFEEKK